MPLPLLSLVVVLLCALSVRTAAGEQRSAFDGGPSAPVRAAPREVLFNVEDASLGELVQQISALTGRRFIQTTNPKVKITVISPSPITREEAYRVFLSVLRSRGMTVVRHGRFGKIVNARGVHTQPTPVLDVDARTPRHEAFYTQLYRLRFAEADDLAKVLQKFKSRVGKVTEAGERLLVLTDTGASIRRLIRLIEELDTEGVKNRLWVEPIEHRSAHELAKLFTKLYTLDEESGLSKVLAEENSNSLIILGDRDSYYDLKEQLAELDNENVSGRFRILPLDHADASEVAKLLDRMLESKRPRRKGVGNALALAGFEGTVNITADETTNSLIVGASPHDFAQLQLTVEKLDEPRLQVFIEAVILDLSVERSRELNIGYHGGVATGSGPDATLVLAGFDARRSIAPSAAELQALALGVRGPALDVNGNFAGIPPGVSIPAFGAVLTAIARSGSARILATPHLLVLDNQSAELSIGENVPLQTGLPFSAGGNTNNGLGVPAGFLGRASLNAPRSDVGTTIKLTPHINDQNRVRLEIEEEISEVGASSGELNAVSINQRSARTTVMVNDQQTVVIGGLQRETEELAKSGVPLLSDLPVLGALFRSSRRQTDRTNLLLLLTPHVVRDQEDLRRVFQRKLRERQEFLDRYVVFNPQWRPSSDFKRGVGLVEDIRQSMAQLAEAERLKRESQPPPRKIHQAQEALDLATEVRKKRKKRRKKRRRKRRRRKPRKRR